MFFLKKFKKWRSDQSNNISLKKQKQFFRNHTYLDPCALERCKASKKIFWHPSLKVWKNSFSGTVQYSTVLYWLINVVFFVTLISL